MRDRHDIMYDNSSFNGRTWQEYTVNKCKLVFEIVLGILFAGIAVFLLSVPIVNNNIASETARRVKEIELPEATEYIESFSKAGKLVGNGNGMQYLGGILIESELSLEDLESYYSQYAENEWECIVEKQTGKNIRFVEHGTVSLNGDIDGDNFYIVYSWGDGDSIYSELDLRGH